MSFMKDGFGTVFMRPDMKINESSMPSGGGVKFLMVRPWGIKTALPAFLIAAIVVSFSAIYMAEDPHALQRINHDLPYGHGMLQLPVLGIAQHVCTQTDVPIGGLAGWPGDIASALLSVGIKSAYAQTGTAFSSAALNADTGVLEVTFSETIDASSIEASKFHIREQGTPFGYVTLSPAELGTGADSATVTFTLTAASLQAVVGMAVPELVIDPSAARDTDGNPIAGTFDVSTADFVHSFDVSPQETVPSGMAFSADGAKMFVVGNQGDDVNEYTLPTPFDVSTAEFVHSFLVSSQETIPTGVAFSADGTKMFVVGNQGDDVNEYTLSTPFNVSTADFVHSFGVSSQDTSPTGVAFSADGSRMFVVGYVGDDVNEYTLSTPFDVSTAGFVDSFSVSPEERQPSDVAFSADGSRMFVVGYVGDDVNEYTLSTPFDVSTADFAGSFYVSLQESEPTGVAFSADGSKMFVTGYDGDNVNEYTLSYAYPITVTNTPPTFVSSELDIGTGVLTITFSEAIDVTPAANVVPAKIHVRESGIYEDGVTLGADELGTAADGTAISFTLTAPHLAAVRGLDTPELTIEPGAVRDTYGDPIAGTFDVSTADFVHSFDVSSQDSLPEGVAFSSDGAKMFVVGSQGADVNEYTLSTPFDVSTAEFVHSFDVSSQDTLPSGVAFSAGGTKMFVAGYEGGVNEYTLSTPFDVSTAGFVHSFDVSSQDSFPSGVAFSADGTKMFVAGSGGSDVYEYTLPTPFDVSTADFVHSFDVLSQEPNPTDVAFSADGAKMFVAGFNGGSVSEYTLSTHFNVSTADFVHSFDVSSQETGPSGVAFSADGSKMFVVGYEGDVNEYALSYTYPITVTDTPLTFVSSELDIGTGVLTITFSEAIDVTPAANVVPTKIHVREQGTPTGYVTLSSAELGTAADGTAISFTLTAPHLAAIRGLDTPELVIEPGAVRDTRGDPVAGTVDVSTADFVGSFAVSSQEDTPTGVAFSADGTKMFVTGYEDIINEYTLSTPFHVSTAGFVGYFDVSSQDTSTQDVAFSADGSKMFVVSLDGQDVSEYTLPTPFDVFTAGFVHSFDVSSQDTFPTGMAFSSDGTKMFVIGSSGDDVYEYTLSTPFDVSTAGFVHSFDVSSQGTAPSGVAFSAGGAKMFVAGFGGGDVYEYTLSTPFDVSTAGFVHSFDVSSQDTNPTGVAFSADGAKMFVVGSQGADVNEYALSYVYPITVTGIPPTFVSSELDIGTGVLTITFSEAIDVTPATNVVPAKIHVREQGTPTGYVTLSSAELGTADDGTAISFTLTAPHLAAVRGLDTPELVIGPGAVRSTHGDPIAGTFDVSTADFVHSFDVSSQDRQPAGVAFSAGGSKMFVVGNQGADVNEYTLSTPFDVSTAEFVHSFDVSSQDRQPTGVAFSAGGAKMFVVGYEGDVNEYALSTPFDVSTAEFVHSFDVSSQDNFPTGVAFSTDGSRMFVAGFEGQDVNEYTLSTPFDVSTAGFVHSFDVSSEETSLTGMAFSADGAKMFVTGHVGDDVYEYALSTPFDVSTAGFVHSFDVSSEETNPFGVAFSADGTKMFVTGTAGDDVNEYALSSVYPITVADTPLTFVSSELDIGTGVLRITFSEAIDVTPAANVVPAKIHVRESGIYEDGVTLGADELGTAADGTAISFTLTAPHLAAVRGLDTPELTIEPGAVRDTYGDPIAGTFDVSTADFVHSFDVSSQDAFPTGVAFSADGSKMFVVGYEGDGVNEYALSTSFDVSTVEFVHSFNVSSQDTFPTGVAFSADGSKMFVAGYEDIINEYTLSTSFDVSTVEFVHSFNVSSQGIATQDVAFSADGSKMFVVSLDGQDVNEYTLSTPFDVSTAGFVHSFDVSSQEDTPTGVAFSADGTKMFVTGYEDIINEYTLSTPFDVSTAGFVGYFDVSSQDTATQDVAFPADGSKMFVVSWDGQDVSEYELSSVYPITVTGIPPTFVSSELDLGTGVLTITFSEAIDVTSAANVVPAKIHIREQGTPTGYVTLSSAELGTAADGAAISFTLTAPHLATVRGLDTPELVIGPGAVRGTHGDPVAGTFDVSTADFVHSFDVSSQDTIPSGVAFSADGSRMFVAGFDGGDVYEYTLSTPFDVSTAEFVHPFDVSLQEASPTGVAFSADGSKMLVVGLDGDDVYEYTLSTPFDVSTAEFVHSFDVSSQESEPSGVAFSADGSRMFVTGTDGDDVNEYALSTPFDVSTAGFVHSFDVSSQDTNPEGVAFSADGTKMFVAGYTGADINEYTLSTPFDVSTAGFVHSFDVSSQEAFPQGVAFSADGAKMFVVGNQGSDVNEYELSSVYPITVTWPPTFVSSELDIGTGVLTITFSEAIDVTPATNVVPAKIHVREQGTPTGYVTLSSAELGTADDGTAISFTLTAPHLAAVRGLDTPELVIGPGAVRSTHGDPIAGTFDVSTADFVHSFDVSSQDRQPAGVAFSAGGSKMFVVGNQGADVNEYTLSTPFDVSTAEFVHSFDVSSQDRQPTGVAFSAGGAKMFVVGYEGDVNEYALSTPFDVSTAEFVHSFDVSSQDNFPTGVAFSTDGSRMFVAGFEGQDVNEYTLSTPFDVSTAGFVHSFDVSSEETSLTGMAFSADGAKMFVTGHVGDDVYEYALSTPFDVSTAGFVHSFDVSSEETNPFGVAFSADGTKMFVTGTAGDDVNEYALSSVYPITVADTPLTFVSSELDIGTGVLRITFSEAIDVTPAANVVATKMHVREQGNYTHGVTLGADELGTAADGTAISFTLTAPHLAAVRGLGTPELTIEPGAVRDTRGNPIAGTFDVSTADFVDSFSVSSQDTIPSGVAFSADGAKMFVVGSQGDDVNEYTLSTPFDVSTAEFVHSFDVSSQDTLPSGVAFSAGGAKMFVAGFDGGGVSEYTLSTPFDVATAGFVHSFNVSSQDSFPAGVAFSADGTKMFVAGFGGQDVNEYTLSTPFNVATAGFVHSFGVLSQEPNPTDVAFSADGAKMFVAGFDGGGVSEYTLSTHFDVSTADFVHSFDVSSQETGPSGVAFSADGSKMFVTGTAGDDVNEYALSSVYPITVTWPPTFVSSELDIGTGVLRITFSEAIDVTPAANVVATKMHVREQGNYTHGVTLGAGELGTAADGTAISFTLTAPHLVAVRGLDTPELTIEPGAVRDTRGNPIAGTFDVSTADFVDSFDVSSQDDSPQGVAFSADGAKMFVVGSQGDDVNEYTLSTPFDVSTAGFVDSFLVSSQDDIPEGVAFSADGTKMFVVGSQKNAVNEYTLSTPFDVSTAGFVDSFLVSSQDQHPTGMAFSAGGAKMFVVGNDGDDVYEYTLSTPFDVSTAGFVDSFDVSSQNTGPRGVAFSAYGSKMFMTGHVGDDVYEYTLSTPFDVSTAGFVDYFSVSSEDTYPTGVAFSADGAKMFVVGRQGDNVNEYALSSVYPITVADTANRAPTVNAGQDQEVAEGATVTLSGTVSDDDPEDTLTYEWTHDGPSGITFANSAALSTTFTAPDVAANTTITVTLTANDGTVDASDTLQVTVTDSPNSPPEVEAGADQEVVEGATVSLSGTATDADPGDTPTYSWTHDSALAITITDSDSLSASFTAPNVAANTTITVTLTVNDGTVDVSDTLQVTITDSPNSPPEVEAGADQEVAEGATVTLSGTVSDDDPEDTLTYEWTHDGPSGITFANSAALSTTFTAPDVAANTTITVTLTANDGTVDASDTLQVTVTDSPNSPPEVEAGADQEVAEGATVTLSGTVSDDDPEDTLTYEWTHDGPSGITFANSAALSTTFTAPDVAANTTITVTLTANDGTVDASDTLQVTVTDSPNSPPEVEAGADQEVAEGATVSLSGTATDADPGDTPTYSWTHDSALAITITDSDSLSASFTAPNVAANTTITVTLTVNDGTVDVSDTLQVTITDSPNSPPEVEAGADQEVAEGATVTLSGTVSDDDPEDTLTYEWTHDGPSGITFANSAALSTTFTAPDVAANTTITVTLTANDGTVDASDTLQVTVTDSPNSPPEVEAGADQEVAEGATVTLSGTVSDDDPEDTLTYEWTHDGPSGITFANSAALSTTFTAPDVAANTTITVTLTANDGTVDASDTLQVTVTDSPNSPPEVEAGADQEVAEGATVSLSGTATDADPGDTPTYSWTHDSALAITITDSDSLSASFTAPNVAANTTITVTLTVNDGTVDVSDTLQVTITDSPNSPPEVEAGADQEVAEGATVTLSGTVSDDDPEDTLTYEWTHDGPSGITFANSAALSTTFTAPDVAANTTITVTLTANDGTVDASDTLQVTVTDSPNSPPTADAGEDQFITKWKTTDGGESITIPVGGTTGSYTVDWGDGTTTTQSGDATHEYATAGTYTVSISDDFTRINLANDRTNAAKLLSIEQWGTIQWDTMREAFYRASNMAYNATDTPNLSGVTDMYRMFNGATSFNGDINSWDVSSVEDMSLMFFGATSFSQSLNSWDVSSVDKMISMFYGATSFNGDISGWDVSSVTDMSHMFNGATSFNGDISGWDVSSVEDMANMFNGATSFNQSLNSWDVSSVTDMGSMFSYATTFNQSLNSWNVSSVDEMISMFNGATSFNGDINSWDVSSVEDMSVMFNVATSFNQDLNSWDVSSVTDMYRMFYYATSFNQSLNSWDVSSVTRTGAMFHGATSFNGDISGWDVASVTDMSHMFNGATSFNGDITAWDVQPTTDTYRIFHGATAFTYNPPWL